MSELASSVGVPDATANEILQSVVYVMNLDSSEFPVIIEALGIGSTVQPISVTVYENGAVPLGTPEDSKVNRRWIRVTIANPNSTTTPPLVVDTLVLKSTDLEPPFVTTSQYIRVVIRNVILPAEGKPH
jgi:hypothetical protein